MIWFVAAPLTLSKPSALTPEDSGAVASPAPSAPDCMYSIVRTLSTLDARMTMGTATTPWSVAAHLAREHRP